MTCVHVGRSVPPRVAMEGAWGPCTPILHLLDSDGTSGMAECVLVPLMLLCMYPSIIYKYNLTETAEWLVYGSTVELGNDLGCSGNTET